MLLFFRKDLDLKPIETNRFHEITAAKNRMRELIQFANMLLKDDGPREVERLTKLVQNGRPAL